MELQKPASEGSTYWRHATTVPRVPTPPHPHPAWHLQSAGLGLGKSQGSEGVSCSMGQKLVMSSPWSAAGHVSRITSHAGLVPQESPICPLGGVGQVWAAEVPSHVCVLSLLLLL